MDRQATPRSAQSWYFAGPYRLAATGVALSLLANALHPLAGAAVLLRVLLLVSGVLVAATAVAWRLRDFEGDAIGRSRAAVLVAFANLAVLGSYLALNQQWGPVHFRYLARPAPATVAVSQEWDSMRMALIALWWVGVAGAVLVYLPSLGRKIVVSAAIVFHFSGITTAVTAVNVGASSAPWLPTTLWNNVYRNYLTFVYLNNAYHFYSPEPGPPTLVWFQVEYADGSRRWVKLVNRDDYPTRLQYQRMLALTESVNRYGGFPDMPIQLQGTLPALYHAGLQKDLHLAVDEIQWTAEQSQLYHQPHLLTHRYIASYVRYVARTTKSDVKPSLPVKHVRVYKLWLRILDPREMRSGMSPLDRTAHLVWYMGQYRPDGTASFDAKAHHPQPFAYLTYEEGELVQRVRLPDPFLYWFLPIYRREVASQGEDLPTAPFLTWFSTMHRQAEKAVKREAPPGNSAMPIFGRLYDRSLGILSNSGRLPRWRYVDGLSIHSGDDAVWQK